MKYKIRIIGGTQTQYADIDEHLCFIGCKIAWVEQIGDTITITIHDRFTTDQEHEALNIRAIKEIE